MVPAAAHDPFALRGRFDPRGNALLHVIERLASHQIDVQLFKTAGAKVNMRVVEAGHNEVATQINHLRLWSYELLNFTVRADRNKVPRRNS